MGRELVTKSGRFYCISLQPDICKTPIGPSTPAIPYTVKGEFAEATGVSTNITSNQEQVVIHASTVIPTVTGDEKGTAKGVKSKTVGKQVQHDQKSSTVSFNGERAIRVGDTVFMNDKNTIGKVLERPMSSPVNEIPINSRDERESPSANVGSAALAVGLVGLPADQGSEFSVAQLRSLSAFIPPALLNKVPGGAAARTLSENVSRITGLMGKETSIATPGALRNVPEKGQSTRVGIDGGSSRGKPVHTVTSTIRSYPPPPEVTAVGGDARVVKRELAKLPENVLSTLKNGNIKIIAVRDTIVEAITELHNVVPRGWGGLGKTWDDVPGIFMPERNLVAVATSDRNATGSGNMILHEVGHAYDHAMGGLSQSLSFSVAYEADKNHYSAYYLQAGTAGREEAFAESFANYYSKSDSYFADKPRVLEYWKNLHVSMQTGRGRK